eukprot:Phypoly_transcript_00975.p1 GENE.Phypoly_transcript_00975~~Phypoly_transcript_00975.p1  ORF type:complete len:938 (+),score=174.80 Phypoly_transcript_00975:914-3727(+)
MYRSEIKKRVVEIWQGVCDNQLLANLFLETVRSLYRLPQDGDFGVTYWTYVHNFVLKVSQNPATDRGLMALRKDLNIDFLENHSRMGQVSGTSFQYLHNSINGDDTEISSSNSSSEDKTFLKRTVATRRIPLGSTTGPRLPSFSSTSSLDVQKNSSHSFLKSPSSSALPPSTFSASSTSFTSSASSSLPSLLQEKSEEDAKNTSQLFIKSPFATDVSQSFIKLPSSVVLPPPSSPSSSSSSSTSPSSIRQEGSITSASSKSSLSLNISKKSPSHPSSILPSVSTSSSPLSRESSEGCIPSSPQILVPIDAQKNVPHSSSALLVKSPSANIPPPATSPSSPSPAPPPSSPSPSPSPSLPSLSPSPTHTPSVTALSREGSGGKVSATFRRILASPTSFGQVNDQDIHTERKAYHNHESSLQKNSKSELTINSRTTSTEIPSVQQYTKKLNPSFWETAISGPLREQIPHSITSQKGHWDSLPDMALQYKKRSDCSFGDFVVSAPSEEQISKKGEPNLPITQDSAKEYDIMAAIENLISDQDVHENFENLKTKKVDEPPRPQLIRAVSTRRATKRVVFLEKRREDQIVAVLKGHDVTSKILKQAIHDADCSVLIPGLLSALSPILPSKKEAAICADHCPPDMGNLPDLSDCELAQMFIAEMAATPRAHQRVEALSCRSGFELKASMIYKALKTHFTICSQLTTNYRLRDVIENLIAIASKIPIDSSKDDVNVHEVIQKLSAAIPEFPYIIKAIVSENTGKDIVNISIAWTELQYGVSVCKQEISKCAVGDPLIPLLTNFIKEAEPELEQLQKEINVWEAITNKIGFDINELLPLSSYSGEQLCDSVSILLSALFLIQEKVKESEEKHSTVSATKSGQKKHKAGTKNKHNHPTYPNLLYNRGTLCNYVLKWHPLPLPSHHQKLPLHTNPQVTKSNTSIHINP